LQTQDVRRTGKKSAPGEKNAREQNRGWGKTPPPVWNRMKAKDGNKSKPRNQKAGTMEKLTAGDTTTGRKKRGKGRNGHQSQCCCNGIMKHAGSSYNKVEP